MKHLDNILTNIACEQLGISTLKRRRSDALDFHDVAVWQVETALKAAFDAGAQSVGKSAKPQGTPQEEPVPAPLPTPLLVPKGTRLVPGKMYLRLYHGRIYPDQELDEWSFIGPVFGPLSCYVHTYCCNFHIYGESDASELWLEKHQDMIKWDGCFFGDMEVFLASDDDRA